MHYRIRVIAGLLTICVLGINGFQAYWLYSTTQLPTMQVDCAAHKT
jgi:two-component system phosphate regulon sensor histidine kinase PhoR